MILTPHLPTKHPKQHHKIHFAIPGIAGYLAAENPCVACNPTIANPDPQRITAGHLKHSWRSGHYPEISNEVLSKPAIVIDRP